MTVAMLKGICKERELLVSGKKADLIMRLNDFDVCVIGVTETGMDGGDDENSGSNIIDLSKLENVIVNNEMNIENGIDSSNDNAEINNETESVMINKPIMNVNDNLYKLYNSMSLDDLRDVCVTKYIDFNGTKEQLLNALLSADLNENQISNNDFDFSEGDSYSDFYKSALAKDTQPLIVLPPATKKYKEIK